MSWIETSYTGIKQQHFKPIWHTCSIIHNCSEEPYMHVFRNRDNIYKHSFVFLCVQKELNPYLIKLRTHKWNRVAWFHIFEFFDVEGTQILEDLAWIENFVSYSWSKRNYFRHTLSNRWPRNFIFSNGLMYQQLGKQGEKRKK